MTQDTAALTRFQSLLRELFQFDSADLDFGIYRILNERRQLFADWVEKDLPAAVRKALSAGAVAAADDQARRLEELAANLREEYEDDMVIDGVAPLDPMLTVHAAVTRATLDGRHPDDWFPEQKLTVEEAVRAYTVGSAYAEFQEHEKGTLAPGMLADFVIWSQDIFDIAPERIPDTRAVVTVVDGRVVYEAE